MAWWGKVIGGVFGLMIGGPIGILLGAAFGHKLDKSLSSEKIRISSGLRDQERTQAAFFTATFAVMGHVSKADGQVSKDEISLAEELMGYMRLSGDQKRAAITLFNKGKCADFNLDEVLFQFKQECQRHSPLIKMFLEFQVRAALSDGSLDSDENQVLIYVADTLGFRKEDLRKMIDIARGSEEVQSKKGKIELKDAYRILGVTRDTPISEVKTTYRRLLSQHHPDKLISKGLPEEMIKLANEKTHEIQIAWQKIQNLNKS